MENIIEEIKIATIIEAVQNELHDANNKFPAFNSPHEGYAVLKEEVDELWEEIKKNNLRNAEKEAVQVAAMAIKFIQSLK